MDATPIRSTIVTCVGVSYLRLRAVFLWGCLRGRAQLEQAGLTSGAVEIL